MPQATVTSSAKSAVSGTTHMITVRVTNAGANVALTIRLKLLRSASGERVLPTYYSDNYFSLLPGEAKQVTLEFEEKYLAGEAPKLVAEGWNVDAVGIAVP